VNQELAQAGLEVHLAKCPYLEVRLLHIRVEGGTIIITGKVRSYYMKQMAQEFVEGVIKWKLKLGTL